AYGSRVMGLEGNLRDLHLQEVFQLLAHSRKTGSLQIVARLAGLVARVSFERGAILDAQITGLAGAREPGNATAPTRQQVQGAALELLTWKEGAFRFVPGAAVPETGVRLNTEVILVECARRIETWARIADRIPHARAVPSFVNVESTQLPLLYLAPQQWEVLTCVDGQRDLVLLAQSLNRDLIDVAETIHGLIETGLLTILDGARATRTHATPPSVPMLQPTLAPSTDIWVPARGDGPAGMMLTDPDGYDAVFDPIRVGVITPEGLPSLDCESPAPLSAPGDHRKLGDAAALHGDFVEALSQWSACLRNRDCGADADHAREAVALVARLQELLHPASHH
ncbi:MAG: DUF4388 domain-containing protein, partial [Gemmatimonadota bacterium]|nr:DUF4388 domain-containing protein [Gemmatimonadota bacterium]